MILEYCGKCDDIQIIDMKKTGWVCYKCNSLIYPKGSKQHHKAIELINDKGVRQNKRSTKEWG